LSEADTIVAIATPSGKGGVGIVRVSGPLVSTIAKSIVKSLPVPRKAEYLEFSDDQGDTVDQGIAIRFVAPNSFTGEDILELHAHGGPVILDVLMQSILRLGARIANPGEFTERAFLNDKIDLTQAEAIADLIEANSIQAAKKAIQSYQGVFSEKISELVESLIQLRIFVEAAMDFPEEEIDFLSDHRIKNQHNKIQKNLKRILSQAQQGAILREGLHVVIVGLPNAGKSSLLNSLAGRESAIVTDIPGTTRDLLKEQILIDGVSVLVTDTAGLRESSDVIEKIGIEKAKEEIAKADVILLVVDSSNEGLEVGSLDKLWPAMIDKPDVPVLILRNKSDLTGEKIEVKSVKANNVEQTIINISAKRNEGVDLVRNQIKKIVGIEENIEGGFLARRRHLRALELTLEHLDLASVHLEHKTGELLAEELKICQQQLSEITGKFSSDDLLGKIFSSFCIGK